MKDIRFAKLVVFVNAVVPLALMGWDAAQGKLGADPVNFTIRTTGMLALIFLSLSLVVTPLRKITGVTWLFHFRRMLGLFAFFYASCHFLLFFGGDRGFNVGSTISEMFKRKYLFVGSAGLLLMVPLAATSFNRVIKRMGARRWQMLHKLAYVAAAAGVLHYYMLVKADIRKPVAFALVVGLLLTYRLMAWLEKPKQAAGFPVEQKKWSGVLRVDKVVVETPDVRTFRLVAVDRGMLPFAYQPGQYLPVMLEIEGKRVHRTYTIASSPTRPEGCELTIKREMQGVASGFFHQQLRVGDVVKVASPGGNFTFNGTGAKGVVLLGAGVGITPLMAIVRYLTDQKWAGDIYLVYSNKTQRDIVFRDELAKLQQEHANLHVMLTVTRGADAGWSGEIGRIGEDLLRKAVPGLVELPVYVCGPTEMIRSMRELLPRMGVKESNIHVESFGTPTGPVGFDGGPFQVTFARSKKAAEVAAGESLLEAGERLEIPIEFECRSGICGKCRCKLVSGSVMMATDEALDVEEKLGGVILMCQARPIDNVVVDV